MAEKQVIVRNLGELSKGIALIQEACETHSVFAFYGEMGAGKTTLIKAFCESIGISDYATSPTFSLVNEYRTPEDKSVFHFDFYRINTITELYDIGYEEYVYSDALCFIEWPNKAEELIPENAAKINIEVNDDESRTITLNM
jgi:tRNA threonylcarbamoyladenosine biosynthesis protein TsaE